MAECGANTTPIDACLACLKQGGTLYTALSHPDCLPSTRRFVQHTFQTCTLSTPAIASSFVFGREGLVPDLFQAVLHPIDQQDWPCHLFKHYLTRHIELDEGEHFPKAQRMLCQLCGDNTEAWAST